MDENNNLISYLICHQIDPNFKIYGLYKLNLIISRKEKK